MDLQDEFATLLQTCAYIAKRHLSLATAGNFSMRQDSQSMRMSASGKDKSQLSEKDFIVCNFAAEWLSGEGKPSAEAALHGMIYELSAETSCILHTHSVPVTVLSMLPHNDNKIQFHGYEMQKTIVGFESHEQTLALCVFENDQNIPRLAQKVQAMWNIVKPASGLIVRGHGLYSWGSTVKEAKRHMEGLEFLVECELTRLQVTK